MKTVDLGGYLRRVQNSAYEGIGRAGMFATLGERLSRLPGDVKLPDYMPAVVQVMARLQPTPEEELPDLWLEMRGHFSGYCSRYAVLAMVTACEAFLREAFVCASLVRAAAEAQGKPLESSESYTSG